MLLRSNVVSMKLIASLAPARAEIEAGYVAKADQNLMSGDAQRCWVSFNEFG